MIGRIRALAARQVRHSPIYPLLHPRRFLAYCLGAPKTGTVSMAALFKEHYRAEHEPMAGGTPELVTAAYERKLSEREMLHRVRHRDRELYLEMESSHPILPLTPFLAQAFPDARFFLTFREPRSWLDSIINQHLNVPHHWRDPAALNALDRFYVELRDRYHSRPGASHGPGEAVLAEHGLYTLDGYLGSWAWHNQTVLHSVPADRLMVLSTDQIGSRLEQITAFLGIPAHTLHRERSHSHRAPRKLDLLSRIDASLLQDKLEEHCSGLYDRLLQIQARQDASVG